MKRKITLDLAHAVWIFISFFERVYWLFWKLEQKKKFKSFGNKLELGRYGHFTNKSISIGNDVYIGQGCRFQSTNAQILIGNKVMFEPNVSIHGGDHRTDLVGTYMKDISMKDKLPENDRDVVIGDDVWIGANAIILKGVTIGERSIIGAGSIITMSVPSYTIVVGSKSQKLFSRWNKNQVEEHKKFLNAKRTGD